MALGVHLMSAAFSLDDPFVCIFLSLDMPRAFASRREGLNS